MDGKSYPAKRQPNWIAPKSVSREPLRLLNSLTRKLDEFHPLEGNHIRWYICGPTTYDSAHLGHARNYITFDVIRRILTDYFGYEMTAVMNITDLDDKIIIKARRSYLLESYIKKHTSWSEELESDLQQAWELFLAESKTKFFNKLNPTSIDKFLDIEAPLPEFASDPEVRLLHQKLMMALKDHARLQQLVAAKDTAATLAISEDALFFLLDSRDGNTVTDQQIFRQTAAKYEEEFFTEMEQLRVRPPDIITRVTEFIPEIIEFIQRIISHRFAYVAPSGSVYFDTIAFSAEHHYGKLEPESVGEHEEAILTGQEEKRHLNDFVLWKASRVGEPQWDSPWSKGRPGWHIECSAMASAHFGEVLDIHGGGSDLRFPHHDNELAQAEAYFKNKQWVNYFLHSGHLQINGLKMSKSLKNFITIRQALEKNTPRQLRLFFLLKPWHRVINYCESDLDDVRIKEKSISEFFIAVSNVKRTFQINTPQTWRTEEKELYQDFLTVQTKVDAALRNNLDTSTAINALLGLITSGNIYISGTQERRGLLLYKVASYLQRILTIFGLLPEELGWNAKSQNCDLLAPYLDVLAAFRQEIRTAIWEKRDPSTLIAACDRLRNETLLPLGVRLEDSAEFPWKLVDAAEIQAELSQQDEVKRRKILNKISTLEADLKRQSQAAIPPQDLFRQDSAYSKFSESGLPTHDKDGKEISKKSLAKLEKLMAVHLKKHAVFQEALKANPNFLADRRAEIESLKAQLNE